MVRAYQEHGPVLTMPGSGGQVAVLAGPDANLLLAQEGYRLFSSKEFYAKFVGELGSTHFVVALDGPPHRQMRQIMKPAFGWDAIAGYFLPFAEVTDRLLRSWQDSAPRTLDAAEVLRRLITDQTSLAMMGHAAGGDFDAFSLFFRTALNATLGRYAPGELASEPYLRAKARAFALLRELLAAHRVQDRADAPDYLDLLLAAQDEGDDLDDDAVLAAALVPFFAGIDTVAYTSVFLLYHLLADPALLARVRDEVDTTCAAGKLDLPAVRRMSLLRGLTMETLRIYPVAPGAVRTVAKPFRFAGVDFAPGQQVFLATPVTHFLPELFPRPFDFEPERYQAPRNEHAQPGAYAPFFKGSHTCPGAGLGMVQVMLTIAMFVHHLDLQIEPGYRLELVADPILRPRRCYTITVQASRVAVLDTSTCTL